MITPDKIIDAVVSKLVTNKADAGITDAEELSHDIENIGLQPPYCIVFEDFTEVSDSTDNGVPVNIPTDISVLCSSNAQKTLSAATSEAYKIAIKVMELIPGNYKIKTSEEGAEQEIFEFAQVYCKPIPIEVMSKSSEQTVIKVLFQYNFNLV